MYKPRLGSHKLRIDEVSRRMRERGFTMASLAKKAGLNPSSIQRLFEGNVLSAPTIAAIASALGCTPDDIIDFGDTHNKGSTATKQASKGEFVALEIDEPDDAFEQGKQVNVFIVDLDRQVTLKGVLIIHSVTPSNSVRMVCWMSDPDDVENLLRAFSDGRLAKLHIKGVERLGAPQQIPEPTSADYFDSESEMLDLLKAVYHKPRAASDASSLLFRLAKNDEDAWQRFDYLYRPLINEWGARAGVPPADRADLQTQVMSTVAEQLPRFLRGRKTLTFREWVGVIVADTIAHYQKAHHEPAKNEDNSGSENQLVTPTFESPIRDRATLTARAVELISREELGDGCEKAFWQLVVKRTDIEVVASAFGVHRRDLMNGWMHMPDLIQDFSELLE